MMRITKDMVVSFRYVMSDSKGNVLEDTTSRIPTSYIHGAAAILPLLQDQMEGLVQGEQRKVFLLQSSGFCNSNYMFEVFVDKVRPAFKSELILGYPLDESLADCGDDCDCFKIE